MTPTMTIDPPSAVWWRSSGDGHRTWSSPQWASLTGQDDAASKDLGWLAAVHEDDRQQVRDAWLAAAVSGVLRADCRIGTPAGTYVRYRSCASPDGPASQAATAWSGGSFLIEDLTTELDHRAMLLDALRHRVRNTLSSVRSMARLGLLGNEGAEDYAAALDGRIAAMARVQAELIRNPLARTDLAQLVAGELAASAVREDGRVSIDGPVVHLTGRAAETMGLTLHELATNALRHGALAQQGGAIHVRWHVTGQGEAAWLHFDWSETGLAAEPPAPGARGFGTHVLEAILPYQLGAVTSLEIKRSGAQVRIELPGRTSILPPG